MQCAYNLTYQCTVITHVVMVIFIATWSFENNDQMVACKQAVIRCSVTKGEASHWLRSPTNWSLAALPLLVFTAWKPTGQLQTKLTFVLFPYSFEVDILCNLLKAQCDMADWKFLPSLLHLHESHIKLSSWCQLLPPVEVSDQSSMACSRSFPTLPPFQDGRQ